MANKVSVPKTKGSSRYLRGLSIVEMEDTEEAVEQALENPSGTFAMVSKEQSYKLSSVVKTLKSVSADTKYIRKIVDKISETLSDIKGPGDSGIGSTAATGAAGVAAAKKLAAKIGLSGKALAKTLSTTAMTAIISGLAVNDTIDNTVLDENADKRQQSRDLRKQYGDNIIREARKRYQPWWRMSSLDTEDSRDGEYIESYLKDLKRTDRTNSIKKKLNVTAPIFNTINYSAPTQQMIKEPTPTERAQLIAERLKMLTTVPGMKGSIAGEPVGYSGPVSGTSGQGSSGGGVGGGGGGAWPEDKPSSSAPSVPSLTPSEFMAIEHSGLAGTRDNSIKEAPSADIVSNGIGNLKGTKAMMKMVYDGYKNAGFSDAQAKALTAEVGRENGYNPNILFGTHRDPYNNAVNLGMLSMQGDRGKGLYSHLESKGLIDQNGKMKQSQEAINEMARYTKREMETNPEYDRTKKIFLENKNVDPETAARVLGKNYIRWRIDDPVYASHNDKRRGYYDQIASITNDTQFAKTELANSEKIDPLKVVQRTNKNIQIASATPVGSSDINNNGSYLENPNNANIEKVDKRLIAVANEGAKLFEQAHPDLDIQVYGPNSGFRKTGSTGNHGDQGDGMGGAVDVQIRDKKTGKLYTNVGRQGAEHAHLYQEWANYAKATQVKNYPDMPIRWGGYFGGGTVPADFMHIDKNYHKGMAGGSFEAGFTPAMMKRYNISENKAMGDTNEFAKNIYSKQSNQVATKDFTVTEPGPQNLPPTSPLAMTPDRKARILANQKKQATITAIPKSNNDSYLNDKYSGSSPSAQKVDREDMYSQSSPVLATPVYPTKQLVIDEGGKPRAGYETGKSFDETHSLFKDGGIMSPPKAKQANDIVPEKEQEAIRDMVHNAQDLANSALREAKEATKKLTDIATGSSQQKPAQLSSTNIPKNSKNPAPLSNPPKTFLKSTGATNPTQKTPGSDTAKQIPPADTTTMWKEVNEPSI